MGNSHRLSRRAVQLNTIKYRRACRMRAAPATGAATTSRSSSGIMRSRNQGERTEIHRQRRQSAQPSRSQERGDEDQPENRTWTSQDQNDASAESGVVPLPSQARLTMKLIQLRSLSVEERAMGPDEIADRLLGKRVLRLDSLNLSDLDHLEVFNLRELYLQDNLLERCHNLEGQRELVVLVLSCNRISRVESLRQMAKLRMLDLSHNRIGVIDTDELPRSLEIVDLRGNPCCASPSHSARLIEALPCLKRLDGVVVRHVDGSYVLEDPPAHVDSAEDTESSEHERPETVEEDEDSLVSEDTSPTRLADELERLKEEAEERFRALEMELSSAVDATRSSVERRLCSVRQRTDASSQQLDKEVQDAKASAEVHMATGGVPGTPSSFAQALRAKAMSTIAQWPAPSPRIPSAQSSNSSAEKPLEDGVLYARCSRSTVGQRAVSRLPSSPAVQSSREPVCVSARGEKSDVLQDRHSVAVYGDDDDMLSLDAANGRVEDEIRKE